MVCSKISFYTSYFNYFEVWDSIECYTRPDVYKNSIFMICLLNFRLIWATCKYTGIRTPPILSLLISFILLMKWGLVVFLSTLWLEPYWLHYIIHWIIFHFNVLYTREESICKQSDQVNHLQLSSSTIIYLAVWKKLMKLFITVLLS